MLKKFFSAVALLALNPKYLVLFGYSFATVWGLAAVFLFLFFLDSEQYALVIVVTALFGIFVNPVAEAIGHWNLRLFPSEASITQNIFLFAILFATIVFYYIFLTKGELFNGGVASLFMFALCSFFGVLSLEFRHILKLRKKIGLMVLLYNVILPILTTVTILAVMKIPSNYIAPELLLFGALLFCHSFLFVVILKLRNTRRNATSNGFLALTKYAAISFSSGQMTNIFILVVAGIASDEKLIEISIILKLANLVIAPNLVNSQVSLPNFRHFMVSGEKFARHNEFYRHRGFTTMVSCGMSVVICSFIFLEQQIFSLDFGLFPSAALGLLFASNIFIVWVGPLSGLMIAHGWEGLASVINVGRVLPFVFGSSLYYDLSIALIVLAFVNICFALSLKILTLRLLED